MTSLSFLRHRMASSIDPKVQESIRIQLIQEIRRRITSEFNPHEIWLFGSASHAATFDADSDLDILVTFRDAESAGRAWKCSQRVRRGFPRPLDLVFLGAAEFERKKDLGGVAWIAFHEGIKIYPDSTT